MAPKLKLIYFDVTARAESVRLILNAGGVPFEDHRITHEEWAKIKPTTPWGQLPVLDVDGELIAQSVAISRYSAKLAKINGKNELEDLKIDEIVDTIGDNQKKLMDYMFEKDETKKKTAGETLLNETLPTFLKKLDGQAKANNGHLAVPRFNWADIIFVVYYEGTLNILKKDVFTEYSNLLQVKKNVLSVPGIKEYIKKRPATKPPFGGFYDLKNDV